MVMINVNGKWVDEKEYEEIRKKPEQKDKIDLLVERIDQLIQRLDQLLRVRMEQREGGVDER